ncbi:MAG: hypothetical protein AAF333_00530 [Planctomycetota bacterium]
MRWLCSILLNCCVLGVVLVSTQPASAGTTFNLKFSGLDVGSSFLYEADGINLTLTAKGNGKPALLVRSPAGVGVYSGKIDNPAIDGIGRKEVLWLETSEPLNVKAIHFTLVGKWGDEVKFIDADGSPLGAAPLSPGYGRLGSKKLTLSDHNLDVFGTKFGITTTDWNDDFKVAKVHATTVPLSPASAMGIGGLLAVAGLYWVRRGQPGEGLPLA